MPTCLGMMTAGLNQEEKKDFAEKIPELIKNTLNKIIQNETKEASCWGSNGELPGLAKEGEKIKKNNTGCWGESTESSGMTKTNVANCLICGESLEYFTEEKELTCYYCKKTFKGYVTCPNGHSVCEQCHNKPVIEKTKEICLKSKSANPFEIFNEIIEQNSVSFLGCHHAFIAGGAFISAINNCGKLKLPENYLDEIFNRIENQAISGYCGLTGVCGIEPAIGACFAVILGSKCGKDKEQKITMKVTSTISTAIAELTGPSCCRAYSWKALQIGIEYLKKELGITLEGTDKDIVCKYSDIHPHGCRMEKCPYYKS